MNARSIRVSAPGKMMICGEYAVLDGAEAVVASADRRAWLELGASAEQGALPPEVVATRAACEQRLGPLPVTGGLSLDVRDLQQSGKKLGLGSSAAAAAATAGLCLHAHGRDTRDPKQRALALELALEGHRSVAPQGSGADVAASVLGGYVRFRRLGDGVETHPIAWPDGLHTVVVWTGHPARTSDLVARVRELQNSQPGSFRRCMGALADCADQFVSALIAIDLPGVIECFHAYGTAMGELGIAAGVGIVDDTTARVRELASSLGGGAKPSGAGGGDVALAVFSSHEAREAFRVRCAPAGFEVLSIALGVPGERYEEQS